VCASGGFGRGEVVQGSILVILLTDNLEESLQSVKDAGGK
jgi:predicted enzyme related to lactoylglutathione lyase